MQDAPPIGRRRRLLIATGVAVAVGLAVSIAAVSRPPVRARLCRAIAEHGPESLGLRAVGWLRGAGDPGMDALVDLTAREREVASTRTVSGTGAGGVTVSGVTFIELAEDPIADEAFRILSPHLPDAVPHLVRGLDRTTSEASRAEIAKLLVGWTMGLASMEPTPVAEVGHARATAETLARLVRSDPSPMVRGSAVNALGLWTFEHPIDAAWFDVCWDALVACAADRREVPALRREAAMLMTTSVLDNLAAARESAAVGASTRAIMRLLADEDGEVAHNTSLCLPKLFGDKLRPMLEEARSGPDPALREAAGRLLEGLDRRR